MMTPSESGGSGGTRLTLSKRYSAVFTQRWAGRRTLAQTTAGKPIRSFPLSRLAAPRFAMVSIEDLGVVPPNRSERTVALERLIYRDAPRS